MKSDKNKKTKKKEAKDSKKKEGDDFSGMTFAIGSMDLILEITLDDSDLGDKKIEDLNTIEDLEFLKDKEEEFLNTIKIKPNNDFIRQVMLGNKISKKKMFRRSHMLRASEFHR